MSDLLAAALAILRRGWCPIPLCWPGDEGACICGRGHSGHDVGKAPLLGTGYQKLHPTEGDVRRWWAQWPQANAGLLLEPSGLLFIGPDNPESARWAAQQPGGLPPTTLRYSRNPGYLYQRPAGCPAATVKHRPSAGLEIDIKSNGYAVVHGRHQTGCDIYLSDDAPTPAPAWAVALLSRGATQAQPVPLSAALPAVDVATLRVSERIKQLVRSGQDDRYPSRSEALFAAILALVGAGHSDDEIASVVLAEAIGEKAREQREPMRWLAGELARARAKHLFKAHEGSPPRRREFKLAGNRCQIIYDAPGDFSGEVGAEPLPKSCPPVVHAQPHPKCRRGDVHKLGTSPEKSPPVTHALTEPLPKSQGGVIQKLTVRVGAA